uniref:BLOC-3 complex member HPS1 n=1 Tax=Myxine glutinosa TaxID=7769 RepID=UPI00358FF68D
MKCLFVTDSTCDVKFVWTDVEFGNHLRGRRRSSNTLLEPDSLDSLSLDAVVYQMFAPIITSFYVMKEIHCDSYSSIHAEGGWILVFHLFGELLLFAAGGEGKHSEEELNHDAWVLRKLLQLQFGLVWQDWRLLKPTALDTRRATWAALQSLLTSYVELRSTDQTFLVEAVQRLDHPRTSETTLHWLESAVHRVRLKMKKETEQVVHAFILVGTKLLAFYSSHNACRIFPSDLLLLILIAHDVSPSPREQEDEIDPKQQYAVSSKLTCGDGSHTLWQQAKSTFLSKEMFPSNSLHIQNDKGIDHLSGSDLDIWGVAESSPSPHSQTTSSEEDYELAMETVPDRDSTENPDLLPASGTTSDIPDPSVTPFVFGKEARRKMQGYASVAIGVLPPETRHHKQVFLETAGKEGYCSSTPHNVYCYKVFEGIALLLLTRQSHSQFAISVHQLLNYFAHLEENLASGAVMTRAIKLGDIERKIEQLAHFGKLNSVQKELKRSWKQLKKKLAKNISVEDRKDLTQACKHIQTLLCRTFQDMYLTGATCGHLDDVLQSTVLIPVQNNLHDFKDFLLVKSTRNVTLVTYQEEFPGLAHFLYVDRAAGQLITPSLNTSVVSELADGPLASSIQNKVWWFVKTTGIFLARGCGTMTMKDDDCVFSYFLWFEDESGHKLFQPDLEELKAEDPPIGVLVRDYYQHVMRRYSKRAKVYVKCYELFAIHFATVPLKVVVEQCQNLAQKLWDPPSLPLL